MRELSVQTGALVLSRDSRLLARQDFVDLDASLRGALQRLLKGAASEPTRVCVASEHARLFLLPWVPQLTRAERWQALAESRFEQIYGEPPDAWLLRVIDDRPPRPRLVVALPAGLARAVRDQLEPRRFTLGLLDALRALFEREPAFEGCVAEVGPRSACLMMFRAGELRRVRMRRYEAQEEILAAARSEWAAASTATDAASRAAVPTVALLAADAAALGARLVSALGGSRVLELA